MPQLNPAPWLFILLCTWMVFLTILPPKIIAHSFPNETTSQTSHKPVTNSWNWLWS